MRQISKADTAEGVADHSSATSREGSERCTGIVASGTSKLKTSRDVTRRKRLEEEQADNEDDLYSKKMCWNSEAGKNSNGGIVALAKYLMYIQKLIQCVIRKA